MEPKIRFKGFEGEWKETNFKSFGHVAMCKRIFKHQTSPDGDVPFYKIGTFGSEPDAYISQSLFEEYKKKYSFPNKGDILISAAGTIGRTVEYNGENCYYQDSNIVWLAHNNNITNGFLKQLYSIVKWSSLEGATIKRLYNSNILETSFYIPQKAEQQAIASYFTSLDSQISTSTSRLASLKQMKAASLQAMFPQEGETVPKIRFNGFEGEWKTCVLSSIATMHARIGWQNLRKDEFLSSGDYYLITGTDFHDGKISFETCHYIAKERYDQDKNIQLEIDSILITKDGTLGKVAFVDSLDKPATLNAGVFNVRTKDKEIYPKYLFQYLKAPYLMDYVNKNATGGTIKHLNQNMLVNFPVQHPSYKEQVMIGDYLFNLDRQISLQSQRLEKQKQIKSACLDKMFV